MPPFLLNLIPSSAIICLVLFAWAAGFVLYEHHAGYESGLAAAAMKQEIAQKKFDAKVKKDYAKIDKNTPFDGDRAVAGNWLLQYTSASK